jgi:hypothetical protein
MGGVEDVGPGALARRLAVLAVATVLLIGCGPAGPTVTPPNATLSSAVPTAETSPEPSDTTSPPPSDTPSPGASDTPSPVRAGPIPGEPDPALTPGAANPDVTQTTIRTTICVSGWTATVRPPASYTTALKIRQIVAYGYADTKTADYEEDHLISLELGGAPKDPKNLWPEPYTVALPDGTAVSARVKDQLENYLHKQVCSGRMTLAAAQALIAGHWESAWKAAGLGH